LFKQQTQAAQLCASTTDLNLTVTQIRQEIYLAACCDKPGRRWRRHVEALHGASCPCTTQSPSLCRLAAACMGWRQRRTAQSKSNHTQI